MAEEKNPFEMYTDMYRLWGGVFNAWSKSLHDAFAFSTQFTNWVNPFQSYFQEWYRIYEGFEHAMLGYAPWPYQWINSYMQMMLEGVNSSVKVYEVWVKNLETIGTMQAETLEKLRAGEEVDIEEIFHTIERTYLSLSNSLIESLQHTLWEKPFKSAMEIAQAAQKFTESLAGEDEETRKLYERGFNAYFKTMNYWSELLADSNLNLSEMLLKGDITAQSYSKKMVQIYGEAFKKSIRSTLGPMAEAFPASQRIADDLMEWAFAYFDLFAAWLEMPLKIFQGIEKSSREVYWFTKNTFKEDGLTSPENFYQAWNAFIKNVSIDMANNIQLFTTFPKFIENLTNYIQSTNKLYKNLIFPALK